MVEQTAVTAKESRTRRLLRKLGHSKSTAGAVPASASVQSTSQSTNQNASPPPLPTLVVPPQTSSHPSPSASCSSSPASTLVTKPRKNIWEEALQKIATDQRELLSQHLPAAPSTSDANFKAIRDAAQSKKQQYEDSRLAITVGNRRYSVREETDKIIQWLDRFKSVGDVAVSADPVHAGLPWAVVRILLQLAVSDAEQIGALLVGLERVAYVLNRCKIYSDLYSHLPGSDAIANFEDALIELYRVVLKFLGNAIETFGKNAARRTLQAVWRPDDIASFKTECQDAEERVGKEADNIDRAEAKTALQMLHDLHVLASSLSKFERLWVRHEDMERVEILKWISQIPYEDHHRDAILERTDNTGRWLLKHMQYARWKDSPQSELLWVHGIPGAGKTKLVTRVVDDFGEKMPGGGLAYFYCYRADEKRRDVSNVMRSYVKQLAVPQAGLVMHESVSNVYKSKEKRGFASARLSFEECEKILCELVQAYPEVVIVLDALDECYEDERSNIILAFKRIIKAVPKAKVKIFIASRRNDDIRRQLRKEPNISISSTDNAGDIGRYVSDRIHNDRQRREDEGLPRISDELEDKIVETLYEKSQGMFQWVALQMTQINALERESDIRDRLGKLPEGLKAAYDEIMLAFTAQKGSKPLVGRRALQWMTGSLVSFHIDVLVAAVCQDPDKDETCPVDIDAFFVLGAALNLLVVDTSGTCRFAHLSVQEYLDEHAPWTIHYCQELVANVCLGYLLATDHHKLVNCVAHDCDHCRQGECARYRPGDPPWYALLCHSARLWWRQALAVTERTDINGAHRTHDLLSRFFGNDPSSSSSTCITIMRSLRLRSLMLDTLPGNLDSHLQTHIISFRTDPVLFIACLFGFVHVLQAWLDDHRFDAGEKNLHGYSLISIAAFSGNLKTAQFLVENGADVRDQRAFLFATARLISCSEPSIEFFQWLVNCGADVNTDLRSLYKIKGMDLVRVHILNCQPLQRPLHSNALASAAATDARFDDSSLVRFVLGQGAHVNAPVRMYGSALAVSAAYGTIEALKRLINNGASVDLQLEGRYGSALIAAAYEGQIEALKLLSLKGADVNMRVKGKGQYGTALIAAAARGHTYAVECLIDRGAKVNLQTEGDDQCGSALAAAASEGSIAVVQLLLEKGAYANADLEGKYNNAMAAARSCDWNEKGVKIRKLLLWHGAREVHTLDPRVD